MSADVWFLPGVLLAALAGRAVLGWIGGTRNALERVGASVLIGLALVTLVMFVAGLVGAPIRPMVYLPPVAIVAVEGVRMVFGGMPRGRSGSGGGGGRSHARLAGGGARPARAVAWARLRDLVAPRHGIFIAPTIVLVVAMLVLIGMRGWLLPNRFYDSITSFDLLGKVIAAENVFRVSLFDYTPIARGGSYPPLTALFFAFAYDTGTTWMTRAILVPYAAFIVWIFGFARRTMGATTCWWLLAACLLSADFNSYLQLPLTQLPVAALAGGALLYLHAAIGGTGAAAGPEAGAAAGPEVGSGVVAEAGPSRGTDAGAVCRRELWLSATFLALAAWTRADAAVFVVGAWLALWLLGRRAPLVDRLLYGVPAVAVTLAWQVYAAVALGESGAGRFVTHLFWDPERMQILMSNAGRLLLAAPFAFGLAGVALVLALLSHAVTPVRVAGSPRMRRGIGPLAVATVATLVVYTLMYYQTDPVRQDPLPALMTSSYRRGVTAFVLPMWMVALMSPGSVWVRRVMGRLFGEATVNDVRTRTERT